MSMTLRKLYSLIAMGQIAGNSGWLKFLNSGFTFPTNIPAQGGNMTVEMWTAFGTYTPTVGTLPANQANNLLVDLTVGIRGTSIVKNDQEKQAMEYNDAAIKTGIEQGSDALVALLQGYVIAALVAGTPGLTVTLPTGFIDFALPTAATDPDLINGALYSMTRAVNFVKNRGGSPICLVQETAYNHLESLILTGFRPPQLNQSPEGALRWGTAPMFALQDTTNFGAASKECVFVVDGRGFAFQAGEPYVGGDSPNGWYYRGDQHWAIDILLPYAYGVSNTSFIASVLNPST